MPGSQSVRGMCELRMRERLKRPGEDGSGCAIADRGAPNYGYETVQALPDITFSACDDYTMMFSEGDGARNAACQRPFSLGCVARSTPT